MHYDGNGSITYSSSNTSVATVNSSGGITVKGAGTTTITATASQTSTYASKSTSYTITIYKASVSIPSANTGLVYTGSSQTGVSAGSLYSRSGTYYATNAGSYSCTVKLDNTSNYQWSDGTTSSKTISWSIAKASVSIPSATTDFTYTGYSRTALNSGSHYTRWGTYSATNAGTYYAYASLDDTTNYKWSNGYTSDRTYKWTISPAAITSVTLQADTFTYTGSAIEPNLTVSASSTTGLLVYGCTYSNNVNVGTASVTVTGSYNHTGSVTKQFTIVPQSLSAASVNLESNSFEYDTKAHKPSVSSVTINGKTLKAGTDYTVSYSGNGVAVGTYTVMVAGKGNYSSSAKATYTVSKTPLSRATASLDSTSFTYNGKAHKPGATLKLGDCTLKQGSDYTISYESNVDAGKAKVVAKGKGSFEGELSHAFTIEAESIGSASITLTESGVTAEYNGEVLKEAVDYTVSYSESGGKLKAVVKGKGNFKGSTTKSIKLAESLAPADEAEGSESAGSGSASSGTATPGTASSGSKSSGSKTSGSKNSRSSSSGLAAAGTTGTTGTASATGSRKRSLLTAKVSLSKATFTYTGKAKMPVAVVKLNGSKLRQGTDYDVSYQDNVKAGTASLSVTGKGSYVGTVAKSFTIKPASMKKATVKLSKKKYTYTGSEKRPGVKVKFSGKKLRSGKDYTVKYSRNVHAGKAVVKIVGKGNYAGKVSKRFTIRRASIAKGSASLALSKFTYDGTAQKPSVSVALKKRTLVQGADFKVAYKNNVNAGTARAVVKGKGDYRGKLTVKFKIQPESVQFWEPTLSQSEFTYDGKAKTPSASLTVGERKLKAGKDFEMSYGSNIDVGQAVAMVKGKGNYTGTTYATFRIRPASTKLTGIEAVSDSSHSGVKVSWDKRDSQISGYCLRFSTSSDFSDYKDKTFDLTSKEGTSCSCMVSADKRQGSTVYVKVCTYKVVGGTTYLSAWSSPLSTTVKALAATSASRLMAASGVPAFRVG